MRAHVRRLHSPDADLDLYRPDDPEDAGLLIQIMAGPADRPGEESFDIMVGTPRWFERCDSGDDPAIGRYRLVVERWDFPQIRESLTTMVESQEAPGWPELAAKIGEIAKWEFEDYRP